MKVTVSQFCIGSFICYGVALLLLVIGMGLPRWVLLEAGCSPEWPLMEMGLFQYCGKASTGNQICVSLKLGDQDPYFKTTVAFVILGLVFAVMAGASRMCIPVSCITETAAGVLLIIAVSNFAAQAPDVVPESLGSAFFLTTISGAIFLINGQAMATFSLLRNEWNMTCRLPCKSNNVEPEVGPQEEEQYELHTFDKLYFVAVRE